MTETEQPKSDDDPAPLEYSDAERVGNETSESAGGGDAPAEEDDD